MTQFVKNKIGFVVLNYVNYAETISCVESILSNCGGESLIVIIDNDSSNKSYEILLDRFFSISSVKVIASGRNGGYSFGNNIGIRYFRSIGIFDVIIATSDTRVESAELFDRCSSAKESGVAVVGPYIRGDDGGSANPMLISLSLQYIAAIHLGKFWDWLKLLAFATFLYRHKVYIKRSALGIDCDGPLDVYMVHGCFLYLSEHYLRMFHELDEDLFMYGEEDLIAFNCARQGLRVIYDPLIRVYHGDAKSTQEGEFRRRAVAGSMAVLRRKMSLLGLFNVYFLPR